MLRQGGIEAERMMRREVRLEKLEENKHDLHGTGSRSCEDNDKRAEVECRNRRRVDIHGLPRSLLGQHGDAFRA